jgi:molybdopterin-containing oxidoreductase family iron-sulfur binding subunit
VRLFGDLDDPLAPVTRLAAERGGTVLKPEAATRPKIFYLS